MTVEELNNKLYEKLHAEQEEFKQKLLAMEPAEILENAYKYYIREDILMELEENDLDERQCRALLKLKAPLAALYDKWLDTEDSHMEEIRDMIDSFADELARREQLRADMEAR